MKQLRQQLLTFGLVVAVCAVPGCQSSGSGSGASVARDSARSKRTRSRLKPIRTVACLYDQKPWLNLDKFGDRAPEGFAFRLFLDPGTGQGVWRDGRLHVEMYGIERNGSGSPDRELISEWHHPMSTFSILESKLLGRGYLVRLRWALKSTAGRSVEIVARYETPDGVMISAGTKRLRVPRPSS